MTTEALRQGSAPFETKKNLYTDPTDTTLQSVWRRATEHGLTDPTLLQQTTQSVMIQYRGRTDAIHFATAHTTTLTGLRHGVAHTLQLPHPMDTLTTGSQNKTTDWVGPFLQRCRSAFCSAHPGLGTPLVEATFERTYYAIARPDQDLQASHEDLAHVRAEWTVQLEGHTRTHHWERARSSLDAILEELTAPDGLVAAVKASVQPRPRWPVPHGPLPVLWSARAMALLQGHFLQAFEADRVMANQSFLTTLPAPLELDFALTEQATSGIDYEGQPRRPVTLLREGRPAALACNQRVAGLLEVSSTGHARRSHPDAAPTIGFWHALVTTAPEKTHPTQLLEKMHWGLSIHQIEILDYCPATALLNLQISEGYLVHQGREGEPVENLEWSVNLVELLASLQAFESTPRTTGLTLHKHGQALVTEITTPAALSPQCAVPGTVAPSHYW